MAIPMFLVFTIPFYLAGGIFILTMDSDNFYWSIPGMIFGFNLGLLLDLIAIPLGLLVGGFAVPIFGIYLLYE
jgi:hypothetical protein